MKAGTTTSNPLSVTLWLGVGGVLCMVTGTWDMFAHVYGDIGAGR